MPRMRQSPSNGSASWSGPPATTYNEVGYLESLKNKGSSLLTFAMSLDFLSSILMLPELLVSPCALSVMMQVPTDMLSGSLKTTWVNGNSAPDAHPLPRYRKTGCYCQLDLP